MIIRVLFLGVGDSSEGQAGTIGQALVGLYFTPLPSQEMSEGREGRLGRRVLSENLVGPFPANWGSSSPESQRHKWPLPAMWLLWARRCREQWPGGEWLGAAVERQQGATDGENWGPGSSLAGQSFHPSAHVSSILFTPLPGLLEELKGRMNRRVLWKYMKYMLL